MAYRTISRRHHHHSMLDCELEAAEALAGLAHSAVPTTDSDASGSPPLSEDHETVPSQHNSLPNNLGSGNEFEISPSLTCPFDYPSVTGSKSRQNLTEAEKEARRLRRVLANRESARQTIRRRQAMYEELTKKAADLALENQNLKKEKELAAKEYDCLKNTNNSLKAQMTRVVKEEAQDIYEVSNPTQAEMSAPSFFYNHSPMMPCTWRPIFQSLDGTIHLQHGSKNGFDSNNVGESTPFLRQEHSTSNPDGFDSNNVGESTPFLRQEHSTSNPATPFYVLPFPWFIPNPYFPQSSDHNETSVLHQCSSSSPKTPASVERHHRVFLPVKKETEDSNSTQAIHKDDCKELGFSFLSTKDGIHRYLEPHPKQAALVASQLTSVGQITNAGVKVGSLGGEICDINSISSTVRASYEDQGASKNSADASAAIEARKKRKEIMKLKSLHCRPCHLH